MTNDQLLNDFAVRCFRDIADGDYVVARMASRARLVPQFLSASQQAIEKYLKCILLLNRIPATKVMHDLGKAIAKIEASGKVTLDLTPVTKEFVERLDGIGRFRYLEVSNVYFDLDLIKLDRAVWELRRFCTLDIKHRLIKLQKGMAAPKVQLRCGYLEKIKEGSAARAALLWQTAFFGRRIRKRVRLPGGFAATNSPLSLHPEMLDEVLKYVHLPSEVKVAWRNPAP